MEISTAKDFKNQYKIELKFHTNKSLTSSETMNLINALCLQIEEPIDLNQNREKYKTSWITYKMEEVK